MNSKWQSRLRKDPIPWLLESNPWTKYRTLIDLLDKSPRTKTVRQAKLELHDLQQIQSLIADTSEWMPIAVTRFNDPKNDYYKLRVLADFGFKARDQGISAIVAKATKHIDQGMFAVRGALPERTKKGEKFEKPPLDFDEWHASPCNSPLITYSLLSMGVNRANVKLSIDRLVEEWSTEKGWFCHFHFVDGLHKKLQVGCQMAGLMALEVFSLLPEYKESKYAKNAYFPLRFHRDYGKTMYYFGRSKKFWTMKYPFVWYNALYLAEVLTRFQFLKGDELIEELIEWIERSQNNEGRFTPTSMYMIFKGWDFANKKEPSPWITFLCCRILKRYYG